MVKKQQFTIPLNHYRFEDRQQVLSMPLGEERDKALFDMLQKRTYSERVSASFNTRISALHDAVSPQSIDGAVLFAQQENEASLPIDLYCANNGISREMAQRVRQQIGDYMHRHDFTEANNIVLDISDRFAPAEAIRIVSDAFRRFDPAMGDIVEKAGREGRISFEPSHNPHQGLVHHTDCAPEDIRRLPESFKGQPYASILSDDPSFSLLGDKQGLSIYGLYALAHESGHLVASQRYINEHKRPNATGSYPLDETYAEVGSELLREHLTALFKNDPAKRAAADQAYHYNQRAMLLEANRVAEAEHRLQDLHEAYYQRTREEGFLDRVMPKRKEKWPEKKAYDDYTREVVKQPFIAKLLEPSAFYSFSYPLAAQASQMILDTWKEGDKTMPARLNAVMKSGLNYGEAMQHLGLDIENPAVMASAIAHYDAHEEAVLKQIRMSRMQEMLLEKKLREAARSADIPEAGFGSVSSTQIGSAAVSKALQDKGKAPPPKT